MTQDDKVFELLMIELKDIKSDIRELDRKSDKRLAAVEKDISSLKTKFMLVAVTMGLAGGKLGSLLPFLK